MARINLVTTILKHITDYGFGVARFEVQESGEVRHTQTQITIKPDPDESLSDFIERLQTQLLPGDIFEISMRHGKIDVVRLERHSQF